MHNLTIPSKIKKGDTIGFVSPSAGLAPFAPHRIDNAVGYFKKKGYKVSIPKYALKNGGYVSASIDERISDLHELFIDTNVKMIIATIGGNNSNQLIDKIDYELIKENPKIFLGYSDITVLHYALIKKANLATYYGPCVLTQFGEYPKPLNYTIQSFSNALEDKVSQDKKLHNFLPSKEWTEETLDWFKKEDLVRARKMKINNGYEWLRLGHGEGFSLGGTIPTLALLVGTEYWLDPKGSIFFIDIPEGKDIFNGLPLAEIDAYLYHLKQTGVLAVINGLVVGRPYKFTEEQHIQLKKLILEVTKEYNYPILYNANIGHTDPMITLQYGANLKLDSKNNLFGIKSYN